MIQRLYVHNYRCLENFELKLKDLSSALLIGKNGVGKSTILNVLEIFQSLARGVNRVGSLVEVKDFTRGRIEIPIRFEIEMLIDCVPYKYSIAFELPENFKELCILQEDLFTSGSPVFSREKAQVILHARGARPEARFLIDWHLAALPLIQEQFSSDPISAMKKRLAQMAILSPIPSLIDGESKTESLQPDRTGADFWEWATGLLVQYPSAYTSLEKYLRQVFPDFYSFTNEPIGKDAKNVFIRFKSNSGDLKIDFKDLSDGEKCFFICAVLIASNQAYGPMICCWDEPDSYLSPSEVGHFVMELRRTFEKGSQLLITSHNPEAIRKFSDENTFLLDRSSHLEPPQIRRLDEMKIDGDLIDNLIRGDLVL